MGAHMLNFQLRITHFAYNEMETSHVTSKPKSFTILARSGF